MTKDFTRDLCLGTVPRSRDGGRRVNKIFVTIDYRGGVLGFRGTIGTIPGASPVGGRAGDIEGPLNNPSALDGYVPAPGWDIGLVALLLETWKRWNRNDRQAGTPAQEAWLRSNHVPRKTGRLFRDEADALAAAGLNPDQGYEYGSSWLLEEVPQQVLDFIAALPSGA